MRKRAKVDGTHAEIVQVFVDCYWQVLSLAPLGNGAPDLLVFGSRGGGGKLHLIEVKAGKGKLRDRQQVFADFWPVHVLRSADEALRWIKGENF